MKSGWILAAIILLIGAGCGEPPPPPLESLPPEPLVDLNATPPRLVPPLATPQRWPPATPDTNHVSYEQREKAVIGGLAWLAANQEEDGHWDCARYGGLADEYASVAVTGLAVMAFLGQGLTDSDGAYQDNVRRALDWLERRQDEQGAFSDNNYAHNICTVTLLETAGMTNQRWDAARRALAWLCAQQQAGGGWDYGDQGDPRRDRNDLSISTWALMALKSAEFQEVPVPAGIGEKAKRLLAALIPLERPGRIIYARRGEETEFGGDAILPLAIYALRLSDFPPDHPFLARAAERLREAGPDLDNFYQLFFGTLAEFYAAEGERESWSQWRDAFRARLIARQVGEPGDNRGSWDPAGLAHGTPGGRVYSTAMAVLSLEIYFRVLVDYTIDD